MKALKKTVLVFLAVIALAIVVSFFLPSTVHVERTATIEAPVNMVFNKVNDLHTWSQWAPWNQLDTAMQVEYINHGIGKTAGYSWISKNRQIGSGKLVISEAVAYDSIATDLDFLKGGLAKGYFTFKADGEKTTMTWAIRFDVGMNPMARWSGLLLDDIMGRDFEAGFKNLNEYCKKAKAENQPTIEIRNLDEILFAGKREPVYFEEVGSKMGAMYGQIMAFIEKNKLTMTGMPLAVYHSVKGGEIDLECGIPVTSGFVSNAGITCGKLTAGKYVYAIHQGSYENLEQTHLFVQKWISDHKLSIVGGPVEMYLSDPQSEADSKKLITEVYYPIK